MLTHVSVLISIPSQFYIFLQKEEPKLCLAQSDPILFIVSSTEEENGEVLDCTAYPTGLLIGN